MKSIKFKEQNLVVAENQLPYKPLPALSVDGVIITKWKPSFKERLCILFGGSIWLSTLTFNKPLQPIKMSTNREEHFYINK